MRRHTCRGLVDRRSCCVPMSALPLLAASCTSPYSTIRHVLQYRAALAGPRSEPKLPATVEETKHVTGLAKLLADYGSYHRDARNRLTHYFGVPAIAYSVLVPAAL